MDLIKFVNEQLSVANEIPDFRPGDNVAVSYKIVEGEKSRIQIYRGDVNLNQFYFLYLQFTYENYLSIFPLYLLNLL